MAILGAVMKVRKECCEEIRNELAKVSGVSWQQNSPEEDFILLIEAADIDSLHKICVKLEQMTGVCGLYPSYITTAD